MSATIPPLPNPPDVYLLTQEIGSTPIRPSPLPHFYLSFFVAATARQEGVHDHLSVTFTIPTEVIR